MAPDLNVPSPKTDRPWREWLQNRRAVTIKRTALKGYPRLVSRGARPTSLLLKETKDHYYSMMRFSDGTLFPVGGCQKPQKDRRSGYPDDTPPEVMADYSLFLARDRALARELDRAFPDGMPAMPAEIAGACGEGDACGVFARDAWWIAKAYNTVRIVGSGAIRCAFGEDGHAFEAMGWFIDRKQPFRLALAEGIESIEQPLRVDRLRGYGDEEMEELILPSSLRTMVQLRGLTRRVFIPRTLPGIDLMESFFFYCGGHWDPVTYSAAEVILPSDIKLIHDEFNGVMPVAEPTEHWETIRLYGREPIPDLQMWFDCCVFWNEIDILYPSEWDGGAPGSYADQIVAFVRSQDPWNPRFGQGPSGWDPWEEEDFEALRSRLIPYDVRSGRIVQQENGL